MTEHPNIVAHAFNNSNPRESGNASKTRATSVIVALDKMDRLHEYARKNDTRAADVNTAAGGPPKVIPISMITIVATDGVNAHKSSQNTLFASAEV